jgi:WD40 repeat protein
VTSLVVSPDGRTALVGGGPPVILLDLVTGREVRRFAQAGEVFTQVASSPDGRQVAAASSSGIVRTWDTQTGRVLDASMGPNGEETGLVYSPDGKWIADASLESGAGVWVNANGYYDGRTLSEQAGPITSIAFSPDSRNVLTTSRDGTGRLYEAATGRAVQRSVGHSAGVLSGVFSPDGELIATGSDDKTIRLWNTETGKVVRVLAGHSDGVYRVLFTPDGKHLLSFSRDGTARLWNVDLRATVRLACDQLFRDLSEQERGQYGVADTQPSCN